MLSETKKEIKVALYLRVSTDEQTKEGHYGIEIQKERGKSFCDSQEGYILRDEHIYMDEGISGGLPIEKRPALKQLFEDASEGKFNIVIVHKIDRMARDLRVLLNGLEELKKLGVGFRSITEPFDTLSAFGESTLQMVGLFAQLEKNLIRERTMAGKESAARDGKWVMGLTPFGYKKNKTTGKLEIVPTEAKAVKQFFRWLVDEKLSLSEIQRRTNNSKLPAPKHRVYKKRKTFNYWYKRTINRILTNEVYTGTTYYRKYKQPFRCAESVINKKYQLPVEGQIKIKVPQIITPELFNDALNQLLRNSEFARRNQKRNYLFSKIIYCGICGFKMFAGYHPPKKDGYKSTRYYHGTYRKPDKPGNTKRCQRCKQYNEVKLEPIWDLLKEILKEPKIAFSLSENYTTKQMDKVKVNEQLKRVEQELATIEEKRKRLTELYLENHDITSDEYSRLKKELNIEKENLKNERLKLNQFLLSKKEKQERGESMKKLYSAIKEQLDELTYDEKVMVIRLFVHKITLFADKNIADVIFQFPNELLENSLKRLKDKGLEGYFMGGNNILQDNHQNKEHCITNKTKRLQTTHTEHS